MRQRTLTLHAVGDICFGDGLISLGFGVRSIIQQEGSSYVFKKIKDNLRNCDILFGNLECVLSDDGYDESVPTTRYLRGTPFDCKSLTDAGFNVVNVANNHILQYGEVNFKNTIKLVQENNIDVVGLVDEGCYHSRPVIVERSGVSVGFLGYSYEREQYYKQKPRYTIGVKEEIIEDVTTLKSEVDLVIVSLHWGEEYMLYPSKGMVAQAREIIDSGADVLLGHHPHVLQGWENYKDGVIAYSLGNFLFGQVWWSDCLTTAIARLQFILGEEKKIRIEMLPVKISKDFQPYLLEGRELSIAQKHFKKLQQNIDKDEKSLVLIYSTRKKIKMLGLTAAKFLHITKNIFRYEPHVRRFLIIKKILRV